MKIIKTFNKFKLNEDADSGYLKLKINDKVISNWFYLRDAIENGLLEEYFDIYDGVLVEELPWSEYFNDEFLTISDITDMIENAVENEDFEEFNTFFKMLEDFSYNIPNSISISFVGETEDGENYDVTYNRDEY